MEEGIKRLHELKNQVSFMPKSGSDHLKGL